MEVVQRSYMPNLGHLDGKRLLHQRVEKDPSYIDFDLFFWRLHTSSLTHHMPWPEYFVCYIL
jgi:hypothetical protein